MSLLKAYKNLRKAQKNLQNWKGRLAVNIVERILAVQADMYDLVAHPDPARLQAKKKDQQVFSWYKEREEVRLK